MTYNVLSGPLNPTIHTLVEGDSGSHRRAKYHCCGFKYMGLQPSKLPKMVMFGINLPLMENPGGP